MSETTQKSGTSCPADCNCVNCCDEAAPKDRHNVPGLSALRYRIGTHSTLYKALVEQLHATTVNSGPNKGTRPLARLTTRSTTDPAIALLDAWAMAADVLTFYQERTANEGFLGTATERRSVLEMARAIGYELGAGVSARTYLDFNVESAVGAPGVSEVPHGTPVQSLPGPGQLPQTFETDNDITLRADWNELRLLTQQPQPLRPLSASLAVRGVNDESYSTNRIVLEGQQAAVRIGDWLVVSTSGDHGSFRVEAVDRGSFPGLTVVEVDSVSEFAGSLVGPDFKLPTNAGASAGDSNGEQVDFTVDNVRDLVFNKRWEASKLAAFLERQQWSEDRFLAVIERLRWRAEPTVYRFRERLGLFGHNAQLHAALPVSDNLEGDPFDVDWDAGDGWMATKAYPSGEDYEGADVYLERVVRGFESNGFVLFLRTDDDARELSRIERVVRQTITGFGQTARVNGVRLEDADVVNALGEFPLRKTGVLTDSVLLPLSGLPLVGETKEEAVVESVGANTEETRLARLVLDRMVLGLTSGRHLAVRGQLANSDGVERAEVSTIAKVEHQHGLTILHLTTALEHRYRRETVVISANVVSASHGHTVVETLGSGDGTKAVQGARLSAKPLTYTQAATSSGRQTSLSLRVGGLAWNEVATLHGRAGDERLYTVRHADDGTARVRFGDGVEGARLPSGTNNIEAQYRVGVGPDGELKAATIKLMPRRPHGVKSVSNPIAASGSEAPQTLANARRDAPLTVKTFERLVSVADYQDFAQGFAGIGKALAQPLWLWARQRVHLTVAGDDGSELAAARIEDLRVAIERNKDPIQAFHIDGFRPALFSVRLALACLPDRDRDLVLALVRTQMNWAFSFENRRFAQDVSEVEVLAVVQAVDGVAAVVVKELRLSPAQSSAPSKSPFLFSDPAGTNNGGSFGAELLLLAPEGLTFSELAI